MVQKKKDFFMSFDHEEVTRFNQQAHAWWDVTGPFKPLHQMNPCRLRIIKNALCHHFNRDTSALRPLEGLHLLDVGCGGGLLTEPLTRLGATMTGIDAGGEAILVARTHADQMGLSIHYEQTTLEDFSKEAEPFDGIISFELLEHLKELPPFFAALKALTKPKGLVILSTLNRTPISFLGAIIAGEYLLKWVPKGTHTWSKFVRPAELAQYLEKEGFSIQKFFGMTYKPLTNEWQESQAISMNYGVMAALL
ncbi:MAG: bifunctional 2-polyprenyl-6-hydroxyphenol methylase/3-demethylubiquinol 3-O-methyltransferase UbiG [Alphaproteobacteria bacterium]|nr:bifunctional 2-polyprenyl-6-hydroxyphenol methylase/3-demethylubiquinol 3-O-methyltransferase UbiG [Alphaproteobacteria bacterium]